MAEVQTSEVDVKRARVNLELSRESIDVKQCVSLLSGERNSSASETSYRCSSRLSVSVSGTANFCMKVVASESAVSRQF
jgi:hypothetical protein